MSIRGWYIALAAAVFVTVLVVGGQSRHPPFACPAKASERVVVVVDYRDLKPRPVTGTVRVCLGDECVDTPVAGGAVTSTATPTPVPDEQAKVRVWLPSLNSTAARTIVVSLRTPAKQVVPPRSVTVHPTATGSPDCGYDYTAKVVLTRDEIREVPV